MTQPAEGNSWANQSCRASSLHCRGRVSPPWRTKPGTWSAPPPATSCGWTSSRTFPIWRAASTRCSFACTTQRLSHLPILVDPSHGTGKRNKVTPLSRAAVAVGADGLMVEVHHQPDQALSDGPQSLFPDQFDLLMAQVRQIAAVVGRTVPGVGVREAMPGAETCIRPTTTDTAISSA